MFVMKEIDSYGHENLLFAHDEKTGLKAIIAVHDTTLGPALGGTRFWNYADEEEALYDVLRLSRGMSLKNAGAGLKMGGGKAVIIGDPKKLRSQEFFNAYGRFVDRLSGCYYTAEDVNTTTQDMVWISESTKYVTGLPGKSGNPSPFTAYGTYMSMKAGAKEAFGSDSLEGKVVAIQGLGNVGYGIARHVHDEGGVLKVFDINGEAVNRAVEELGATAVPGDQILSTKCDILSPCALGAVFDTENLKKVKAKVICGCANNQLVDNAAGDLIDRLGIVYCPDYIANAGGVINCAAEVEGGYDEEKVKDKVRHIYEATEMIFNMARERKIPTYKAADEYAYSIIKSAKH